MKILLMHSYRNRYPARSPGVAVRDVVSTVKQIELPFVPAAETRLYLENGEEFLIDTVEFDMANNTLILNSETETFDNQALVNKRVNDDVGDGWSLYDDV